MQYVEMAHRVNALNLSGDVTAARQLAESCIDLLFQHEVAGGEVTFRLSSPEQMHTSSSAHIRIAAAGKDRQIIGSEDVVKGMFTNRLGGFQMVAKLCSTEAMLQVRSGDIIFDIEDGSNSGDYPRAAFSSGIEHAILVTDPYWYKYRGYQELRLDIQKHWINWHDRKAIAFWRGSTTGFRRRPPSPGHPVTDWSWLQRLHVCDVAQKSAWASHLDIGVSGIVQIGEPHLRSAIASCGLIRQKVEKLNFLQYRYIVDIDGNACAFDGFYSALLMGACVLKVNSRFGFKEWYYERLRPYEHYVPIRADLTDFDNQIEWSFRNPDKCAEIGSAAKHVADAMEFQAEIEQSGLAMAEQFRGSPDSCQDQSAAWG